MGLLRNTAEVVARQVLGSRSGYEGPGAGSKQKGWQGCVGPWGPAAGSWGAGLALALQEVLRAAAGGLAS